MQDMSNIPFLEPRGCLIVCEPRDYEDSLLNQLNGVVDRRVYVTHPSRLLEEISTFAYMGFVAYLLPELEPEAERSHFAWREAINDVFGDAAESPIRELSVKPFDTRPWHKWIDGLDDLQEAFFLSGNRLELARPKSMRIPSNA